MMRPRPVRLQLSRRKGFKLQAFSRSINGLPAAKVDRSTRWGNPFPAITYGQQGAVRTFQAWLDGRIFHSSLEDRRRAILEDLPVLAGCNLGCWCKLGTPCHADILLSRVGSAPTPHLSSKSRIQNTPG
jgi:hypothetical protein